VSRLVRMCHCRCHHLGEAPPASSFRTLLCATGIKSSAPVVLQSELKTIISFVRNFMPYKNSHKQRRDPRKAFKLQVEVALHEAHSCDNQELANFHEARFLC
jgi:hypothetical protein